MGGFLALLGVLCPVCIPAIAAVLASGGVLILVSTIMKPLFWIMLALFWFGLLWSYQRHHNILPVLLGIVCGVATYIARYDWYYRAQATQTVVWYDWRIVVPAIGLFAVAIWNYRLDEQSGTCAVSVK